MSHIVYLQGDGTLVRTKKGVELNLDNKICKIRKKEQMSGYISSLPHKNHMDLEVFVFNKTNMIIINFM